MTTAKAGMTLLEARGYYAPEETAALEQRREELERQSEGHSTLSRYSDPGLADLGRQIQTLAAARWQILFDRLRERRGDFKMALALLALHTW
jgi:hypothetical protein